MHRFRLKFRPPTLLRRLCDTAFRLTQLSGTSKVFLPVRLWQTLILARGPDLEKEHVGDGELCEASGTGG